MSAVTVEFAFEIGDLVTLKSMVHKLSRNFGVPQRLSVVFRRADFDERGMSVWYYCRVLTQARWSQQNQAFYMGETLSSGLTLLAEIELVAYPEQNEMESSETPEQRAHPVPSPVF